MENAELKKKIEECERELKKAISYMERNPSPHWTPERREMAERAKRVRLERDRLTSELEKREPKTNARPD